MDLYSAKNLGPFVKLTAGYFLVLESRGILLSYPVDCDLPFWKYVFGPTKFVVEVEGTKGS